MEAVPLSSVFSADCARALVFHLITRFVVPDMITSDHGNFLQIFRLTMRHAQHFALSDHCLPSWGERRSQKTASPPRGCALCPHHLGYLGRGDPLGLPRLHSQPNEDTGLSPLRQFLAPRLSYPMSFCKQKSSLSIKFPKIFHNPRCSCFFSA